MLIHWLFFEPEPDSDIQIRPYLLNFHSAGGENALLSRSHEHLLVANRRAGLAGDVLSRPLWAGLS